MEMVKKRETIRELLSLKKRDYFSGRKFIPIVVCYRYDTLI